MLHKHVPLWIALIVLSLIMAPVGTAQAETIRGNASNYEPDNVPAQAKVIASGNYQTRAIIPETDLDWVKFQLTTPSAIVIETSGPYNSDTRIRLYAADGTTEIEISDDEGPGLFSYIDRTCATDVPLEGPLPAGTYYIEVEEYLRNAEIPVYNLFFQSSPCPAEIVDINVGTEKQATSLLQPHKSVRRSIASVNNGPVKIINTGPSPLVAAERVAYKINGVNTSFSEMMGMPDNQVGVGYWLPWYNNVGLDTQLRIANVSTQLATVRVFIAGAEMSGSPFNLAPGISVRRSYPGVNNGPVRIVSTQKIVAAERLIYKVNGVPTSFSEMMAMPDGQLDTIYWLPWYNNVDLDTQLRIANVGGAPALVHVYVAGIEMAGSPFSLGAGVSTRKWFPGINNGPVKIVADQPIVVAERVVYKVNGVNTSFTEMMALPNSQVETSYWLPWYNNTGNLDTQLRIANLSSSNATVHVYIAGVEISGSPFSMAPGASARKNFPGIDNGPVRILSTGPIVAAERLIYRVNNVPASFSEMMALPNSQLNQVFWLPWYNNVDLDTQLRFGAP